LAPPGFWPRLLLNPGDGPELDCGRGLDNGVVGLVKKRQCISTGQTGSKWSWLRDGRRQGSTVYSVYSTGVLWAFIDMVSSLQQKMQTCNQRILFILWRLY